MRPFSSSACVGVATALLGCAADVPSSTPVEASATVSATPAASTLPSERPISGPPTGPPTAIPTTPDGLPYRTDCQSDADCGLSYAYLIGDKCCKGTCSPQPISTDVLDRIESECGTRGYEEAKCPMKKCAAPPPVGCQRGQCVFLARTGPVSSTTDAAERAAAAANTALAKAYAQFRSKPGPVAPVHPTPWTDAFSARVKGPDATGAYTVEFSANPPAGFFHRAIVVVGADGTATVTTAEAGFSPD